MCTNDISLSAGAKKGSAVGIGDLDLALASKGGFPFEGSVVQWQGTQFRVRVYILAECNVLSMQVEKEGGEGRKEGSPEGRETGQRRILVFTATAAAHVGSRRHT